MLARLDITASGGLLDYYLVLIIRPMWAESEKSLAFFVQAKYEIYLRFTTKSM